MSGPRSPSLHRASDTSQTCMEGNGASPGSSGSRRENSRGLQKKVPELLAEIVAQRDPEDNRPVIIMAHDEGRFGRITDIRSCW
jgi:hypothetical protein